MTTSREPRKLEFHTFEHFETFNELFDQPESTQLRFLWSYLCGLDTKCVVEEPYYFDRDYTAEFAEFHSSSAIGYPNVCRRLHFFSRTYNASNLKEATRLRETPKDLQDSYLGFCVIRPLSRPLLGRTVLRWFPDPPNSDKGPRVTETSRTYTVHLLGLALHVQGLAWQQQDHRVGACATVALWSALQSAALGEFHAIPTTVEITKAAHRHGSVGQRVFPSVGLNVHQLCEATQHCGLSPILIDANIPASATYGGSTLPRFSPAHFLSICTSLLRSGYPMIISGSLDLGPNQGLQPHAVCATGFRSKHPNATTGSALLEDLDSQHIYLHDDNLGPNARFKIEKREQGTSEVISLAYDPPKLPQSATTAPEYYPFIPDAFVVAVPNDLRLCPIRLRDTGRQIAEELAEILPKMMQDEEHCITVSSRFIGVREYLNKILPDLLADNKSEQLAEARFELSEKIRPMSLHLGVVRISNCGTPMVDVIFDTTETEPQFSCLACVLFQRQLARIWEMIREQFDLESGLVSGSSVLGYCED